MCMWKEKALLRLRVYTGWCEPSPLAGEINIKNNCALAQS